MKVFSYSTILFTLVSFLFLFACKSSVSKTSTGMSSEKKVVIKDSLLDVVQYQTFKYFWDGAEPVSGMARERIHILTAGDMKVNGCRTTCTEKGC